MIKIIDINLQNNEVEIREKLDKYAITGISKKIHMPNMAELTGNILKGIIEQELKLNYGYSNEVDIWHESNWNYRFYVNNEQIAFLTANYFNLVQSLYIEPINPKIQLSEGILIYANSIAPEAVPLFESLNIIIETKI